MALEERIVAWSKDRPAWQREVMLRVATGEVLLEEDYDDLVDRIVDPASDSTASFGLEHLPKATTEAPSVRLESVTDTEHVNALASEEPLTFAQSGLTIVYGDNGSGKSGYARLLKRITRARHQEEVLSNVFEDTALDKPTAELQILVGDNQESVAWPGSTRPELQRMRFYDGACGDAYVATESDFPYRPSALLVMEKLISACVEVRSRIDARLHDNARRTVPLPVVADEVRDTDAGKFLERLSARTSVEALDELISRLDGASEIIDELRKEEHFLRTADASDEERNLERQAEKLDALNGHIEGLHAVFGDDGLDAIRESCSALTSVQEAADLFAQSLREELVAGVGSSPWKILWESARRFSETHAYPEEPFPALEADSRCVLCQQTLEDEARDRFSRFESFVQDDTQTRLAEARQRHAEQVARVRAVVVSPEAITNHEQDLGAAYADLIKDYRELLGRYEQAQVQTLDALKTGRSVALPGIEPINVQKHLTDAATAARERAEGLADPEHVRQRIATTTTRRKELELLQQIKDSREEIVGEFTRLREQDALEVAKAAAATGPITRKVAELSEESVTDVVRDTFTRETDRLRLERVTITRTRADRGTLLHKPKLVRARQNVELPRVFSEGERTALGLAAFFTEASLDGSQSALILDDPVNSLDHIRRELVAARLAAFAEDRQVIMFTHDVAFVTDLRKAADHQGVSVTERSVARSRAGGRNPGACSDTHPWKAKDVAQRLDALRAELAQIKREESSWDEATYEKEVANWAGELSETWERVFSQEIVGQILADGGLEVRPRMVKVMARFTDTDDTEFQASYSRVSQWVKRHDKSALVNYVAPDIADLEAELTRVDTWFRRVKRYKR